MNKTKTRQELLEENKRLRLDKEYFRLKLAVVDCLMGISILCLLATPLCFLMSEVVSMWLLGVILIVEILILIREISHIITLRKFCTIHGYNNSTLNKIKRFFK